MQFRYGEVADFVADIIEQQYLIGPYPLLSLFFNHEM